MKKTVILILCIALVGGGSVFGYHQYKKSRMENTVVDVVPLSILAQPAEWFDYSSMPTEGKVDSANVQRVMLDTEKLVKEVFVKEGDTVKKGDVILEYDMTVVELQLAQKENQITLTEQSIKQANRELEALRRARPSEEMSNYNDEPYFPDDPDFPDFPDDPEPEPEPEPEPVRTVDEVVPAVRPVSGSGAKLDPFVINCNLNTLVRKQYLMSLAGSGHYAELHVYDHNSVFLYKWYLSGEGFDPASAEDWNVTDGLLIDSQTGTVSIDPKGKMHGQLSFSVPTAEPEPEPELPLPGGGTSDELAMYDAFAGGGDYYNGGGDSMDYQYSRKELAAKIVEKQNQLKTLNLDLRAAQIAFDAAKKQKIDGKVVAEIDGVVKKIGSASGESDMLPAESDFDAPEMYDPYQEASPDDNAFAVIEGKGSKEVAFSVSEMSLAKMSVGTTVNVMSYESGESGIAEITKIDDTPVSYSGGYGSNPNSSFYTVHAALDNNSSFRLGEWVNLSADSSSSPESSASGAVYLPIHYVRQEGGDFYVMKQGSDGRLEKQYVRAGKILWGNMLEITGGLDMKDKICFPFGKNVREGVKTNETTEILYPTR